MYLLGFFSECLCAGVFVQTFEGVVTGREDEHLDVIMSRLAQAEVHRLVIVDSQRRVKGIVSLSDILGFLVLRHDC